MSNLRVAHTFVLLLLYSANIPEKDPMAICFGGWGGGAHCHREIVFSGLGSQKEICCEKKKVISA